MIYRKLKRAKETFRQQQISTVQVQYAIYSIRTYAAIIWWRLFQTRVVCTQLDIYVFICKETYFLFNLTYEINLPRNKKQVMSNRYNHWNKPKDTS